MCECRDIPWTFPSTRSETSLILLRTPGLVTPKFYIHFIREVNSEKQHKSSFVTQREKCAPSTNATAQRELHHLLLLHLLLRQREEEPLDTHPEGATSKRAITNAEGNKPSAKVK